MKKTLALVLALLMVVTCFVACGKKDEDDNNAPVVSTPVTNTSTASGDSSVVSGDISVADSSVEDSSVEDSSVEDSSVADENSIVGSWETTVMDMSELLVMGLTSEDTTGFYDDFTTDAVEMKIGYTYKADGTFEAFVNTDEVVSGLERAMDDLASYMADKTAGTANAVTKDEALAALMQEVDVEEFAGAFGEIPSGTYTVEGNIITLSYEMDGEQVEEEGEFTISGNELTIVSEESGEMVFTKK